MSTRMQKIALAFLILPAFVAIWGGWVGLGRLSGFGPVNLLPGIWDSLVVDLSITLPVSVEAYAALALGVWLGRIGSPRAQRFARLSALAAMMLGALGQVSYHLLVAMGAERAPTPVVILVSVLPVLTLTAAAALLHLLPETEEETVEETEEQTTSVVVEQTVEEPEEPTVAFPPPALTRPAKPSSGSKREQIEAILRTDPETPIASIAAQVGCAPRYARDIRNQQQGAAA